MMTMVFSTILSPLFICLRFNGRTIYDDAAFVTHRSIATSCKKSTLPVSRRRHNVRRVADAPRHRLYSTETTSFESPNNIHHDSSDIKTIAIIGGGIAGLSCAQRLSSVYDVTVYDTGRLRPGGRSSTRLMNDVPPPAPKQRNYNNNNNNNNNNSNQFDAFDEKNDGDDESPNQLYQQRSNGLLAKYMYDHSAQVVSRPHNPRYRHFRQQLDEWESRGILQKFRNNTLFNILSYKKIEPINNVTFYYGTSYGGGIGGLATSIVEDSGGTFQLKQNIWISPRNGIQHMINQRKWKVLENTFGRPKMYDAVIIAHNGKCADQLVRNTPSAEISKLMKVQFQYKVPACGGPCMILSSIYSLTFAVPTKDSFLSQHLPETFLSGYVKNHPALRFISCQTRKYGYNYTTNTDVDDSIEVWTVLSSGAFATKYKAPQENIPPATVQRVIRLLLQAVQEALTGTVVTTTVNDKDDEDATNDKTPLEVAVDAPLQPPSALELSVLDQHLQLWGAGVPMNVYDLERGRTPAGFLYDRDYRMGVVGDWLVESSIAGAYTSGQLLADYFLSNETISHGFKGGSFRRSVATAKAGIGMLQIPSS